MPFNMNLLAKTSKDGSCGLHCFVPTVEKILQNPDGTHTQEKEKLTQKFREHYQIAAITADGSPKHFNGDDLSQLLQDLNPKEKEALLEPVLRKIMVQGIDLNPPANQRPLDIPVWQSRRADIIKANSHLRSNELVYLAHELGITLESYEGRPLKDDTGKQTDLRSVNSLTKPLHLVKNSNPNPYELKIRHDYEKSHWEFEMNCAKAVKDKKELVDEHNAYYASNSLRFHKKNLAQALTAQVKHLVEVNNPAERKKRLKDVYLLPEVIDSSIETEDDLFVDTGGFAKDNFGRISSMIDNFAKGIMGSSRGPNKNDDLFGGIMKFFATFMKAILGFAELATQLGKVNNHEVSPEQLDLLSDEDRTETLDFMVHTKLLASAGSSAQTLASTLNKEWNRNLEVGGMRNSDALWLRLIEGLKRQGKTEEVLELLKQREQAFIQKLKNNPNAAKGAVQVSGGGGGGAADPAPSSSIADDLQKVLNDIDSLKNVTELAQAAQVKQKACLDSRLELYKRALRTNDSEAITTMFNSFKDQFTTIIAECKKSREAAALKNGS